MIAVSLSGFKVKLLRHLGMLVQAWCLTFARGNKNKDRDKDCQCLSHYNKKLRQRKYQRAYKNKIRAKS